MAGATSDTTAQGPQLRFAFKGRGIRLTDEIKRTAEHKLSRLGRMEPRATVLEIEIIARRNPRLHDAFLVEGALVIPRTTFRAHAEAPDVPSAVDRLAERLERQVRDHHSRRRTRPAGRSDGLESAHA
jgi:ribosomal subunit interface protein